MEQSIAYQYDAFGNRVSESVTRGGITLGTVFAYDGWNPAKAGSEGNSGFAIWGEFAAGPVGFEFITTRFLDGDSVDQVFARIDSALGPAWLLADKLGSIRDVTDGTGALRDNIQYNAFGQVTSQTQYSSGGSPTPTTPQNDQWSGLYSYAGMVRDAATGLYHDDARDYSSIMGRFVEQDPMGFAAGDSNLYRYVNNAPTDGTDPSGEYLWASQNSTAADVQKWLANDQSGFIKSEGPGIKTIVAEQKGRFFLVPTDISQVQKELNNPRWSSFDKKLITALYSPRYDLQVYWKSNNNDGVFADTAGNKWDLRSYGFDPPADPLNVRGSSFVFPGDGGSKQIDSLGARSPSNAELIGAGGYPPGSGAKMPTADEEATQLNRFRLSEAYPIWIRILGGDLTKRKSIRDDLITGLNQIKTCIAMLSDHFSDVEAFVRLTDRRLLQPLLVGNNRLFYIERMQRIIQHVTAGGNSAGIQIGINNSAGPGAAPGAMQLRCRLFPAELIFTRSFGPSPISQRC